MRVIVPLDLAEGKRYIEPMCEEDDMDHIYKLTGLDKDWIKPMADGMLCWENDSKFL